MKSEITVSPLPSPPAREYTWEEVLTGFEGIFIPVGHNHLRIVKMGGPSTTRSVLMINIGQNCILTVNNQAWFGDEYEPKRYIKATDTVTISLAN